MKRKILIILIIAILFIPSVSLNSIGKIDTFSVQNITSPEKSLIEGVPYVGQDKNFFCNLACFTMILKYYGINATYEEVIYYMGNGYYEVYILYDDFRVSGHLVDRLPSYYKFLSEQYGLSYEPWETNINVSFEERWNHDWNIIKENISNDTPVMMQVDETVLLCEYLGFKNIKSFNNFLPTHSHYVLIVGYNENNNSICIQDPVYKVMDKPELGIYRWVDLDLFKFAHSRMASYNFPSCFSVNIFKKSKDPRSKEEAFLRAHNRSLELLKGNLSTYITSYDYDLMGDYYKDEDFSDYYFGINGTKKHREHCSKGVENRIKTIHNYKKHAKLGIKQTFLDIFFSFYSKINQNKNIFEYFRLENMNCFDYSSLDKQYTIRYLDQVKDNLNDSNAIRICEYELELFKGLEKNWAKIGNYYSIFLKKGIFMSLPRGMILTDKIKDTLDEIIFIEESIIAGPS